MDKVFLRASEAGEMLGLGRSKIYEMMADGTLPTITIGKSKRVVAAKLQDWIRTELSRQFAPKRSRLAQGHHPSTATKGRTA